MKVIKGHVHGVNQTWSNKATSRGRNLAQGYLDTSDSKLTIHKSLQNKHWGSLKLSQYSGECISFLSCRPSKSHNLCRVGDPREQSPEPQLCKLRATSQQVTWSDGQAGRSRIGRRLREQEKILTWNRLRNILIFKSDF